MRSLVHTVACASPDFRSIVTATSRADRSTRSRLSPMPLPLADPDPVERDVEVGRVERSVGRPDRGEDAAPVRVLPVDRALEEVAPGHRAGHRDRVALTGRVDHGDGDVVLRALGVAEQLLREVVAEPVHRVGERLFVRLDAARPGHLEDDPVVGRHAPVGVEPVERPGRRRTQRLVGGRMVHVGVRGQEDQHGGEARSEHAGALGDAAERPAVTRDDSLLGDRVGGHDGAAPPRDRLSR